jgi:hypothetical protein
VLDHKAQLAYFTRKHEDQLAHVDYRRGHLPNPPSLRSSETPGVLVKNCPNQNRRYNVNAHCRVLVALSKKSQIRTSCVDRLASRTFYRALDKLDTYENRDFTCSARLSPIAHN